MPKMISYNENARRNMLAGVNAIANAVKVTMGPKGRNVCIDRVYGSPLVTKDGVTVAKEIDLEDKFENMGAQLVKEVASKTSDIAGDGTTTATVLAQAIACEGFKMVAAGHNPMGVKRGIDKAVATITAELQKVSQDVTGHKEIAQVGTISANGDTTIGNIIAEAMEKVGKDGVITVEEASGMDTTLELVEGMQFDRGYLSPYFITDVDRLEVAFEHPYILTVDRRISTLKELIPILEAVHQESRPLVIIAEDVEGEALSSLVLNKVRAQLPVVAIKSPGFGDRRKAMMEDIAILTGSTLVSDDLGIKLDALTVADLGAAKRVVVNKDTTTVIDGGGSRPDIQTRIAQVKSQVESATSEYDREKLQERVAKLVGGVAVIHVGAVTETEMKEKKARVEDAMHATRAAVEEGIVPGGGVALIRTQVALDAIELTDEAEKIGVKIVRRAIEEPLRQISANAGVEGSVVVNNVRNHEGSYGYNASSDIYEDLMEAGVVDPTKVVRSALQNASSVVGLMLTTEALIADKPKENPDVPDISGSMGGMF